MLNKVNKIFAVIARPHSFAYVLVGIFISLLFNYYIDQELHIFWYRKLVAAGAFLIIAAPLLTALFYEKYELGRKNLPARGYFVQKDEYFYTKINSNIGFSKKVFGYLYVLVKAANAIYLGFFLSLPILKYLISN